MLAATALPLSFQQEELIERLQTAPEHAPTLTLVYLFQVDGPFDPAAFSDAVAQLIDRHPVLAVRMVRIGDSVGQAAAAPQRVVTGEWPSLAALKRALIQNRPGARAILSGAPLFAVGVHRVEDALLIAFSINHLVFDGWSALVMWRDLSELYAAVRACRPANLPPLDMSYAGFARHQRVVHGARIGPAAAWWQEQLAGHPGSLVWPGVDACAPKKGSCEVHRFDLPAIAPTTIRRLARDSRVPPFVVLLAASGLALSRVTGQPKIFTGSNAADRNDSAKLDAIGYFTNTRLALIDCTGAPDLACATRGTRASWLDSEETCRDVYTPKLLAEIGSPRVAKVNLLDLRADGYCSTPVFAEATTVRVPVPRDIVHWREFELTFCPEPDRLVAEIWRLRSLDIHLVTETVDQLARILSGEES